MRVKYVSMVTKIHKVGCHLAALSGIGGRGSYTWPHPQTAESIEKRLPAPTPQGQPGQFETGNQAK